MSKKILIIVVLVLTLSFSTTVFASLTFTTDAITGTSASSIDLGAGNALSLQTIGNGNVIIGSGNVGIGVAVPAQKLDIAGKIAINGETVVYVPDQNDFPGSFVLGNGGNLLAFSDGGGDKNTFVGIGAGISNTYGSSNTVLGHNAYYLGDGGENIAIGTGALYNNNGSQNVAVGNDSLYSSTSSYNSAYGYNSLWNTTTGNLNVAIGHYSMRGNTTGSNNVAFGVQAGSFIQNGSTVNATSGTSVYLGNNTKALASGDTNEIVIGYNAIGLGSNTVVLGNSSITTTALRGNVGIGTTAPGASSILDISSTTKGVVLPRMTQAQRNAIATPVAGMAIYQTDAVPGLRVYNGTNWMRFTETAD